MTASTARAVFPRGTCPACNPRLMRSWPAAELLEQPCGLAEQRRAALSTVIRLVGLTSLWYLTAIVALVSAKLSVSSLHAPLVLCASQFTTATVLTAVLLRMHESPPPKVCHADLLPPSATLRRLSTLSARAHPVQAPPPREAATVLRRLAAAYSLGFVFTNAALAHAPAPYVETVKSSEPISTVLLAAVLLGERESAASYCALLPVCIGVGMASLSGGAGGGGSGGGGGGWDARLAFVLCLCANVGFSTRAVLAKRLRQVHAQAHAQPSPHPVQRGESKGGEGKGGGGGSSGASGDVRLFFEVSWRGAALLMPAAALLEGGALLQAPSGFAWGAYAARLALNGAAHCP